MLGLSGEGKTLPNIAIISFRALLVHINVRCILDGIVLHVSGSFKCCSCKGSGERGVWVLRGIWLGSVLGHPPLEYIPNEKVCVLWSTFLYMYFFIW